LPRKAKKLVDVSSLARGHTERAIQRLAGIMDCSEDEGVVIAASKVLLDRGWGKPAQDNTVHGELKITIRKLLDK
jgi:hypothetical protein